MKDINPKQFRETLSTNTPLPRLLIENAHTKDVQLQLEELSNFIEIEANKNDEWLLEQKNALADNSDTATIHNTLDAKEREILTLIHLANQGLLLAWNSGNATLTDRLSSLKEHCLLALAGDEEKYITIKGLRTRESFP